MHAGWMRERDDCPAKRKSHCAVNNDPASVTAGRENEYVTVVTDTIENLILDLLEWVGRTERTYQETMDAWRTSCPRLPVWEDATDRGLVETTFANGRSLCEQRQRVWPS